MLYERGGTPESCQNEVIISTQYAGFSYTLLYSSICGSTILIQNKITSIDRKEYAFIQEFASLSRGVITEFIERIVKLMVSIVTTSAIDIITTQVHHILERSIDTRGTFKVWLTSHYITSKAFICSGKSTQSIIRIVIEFISINNAFLFDVQLILARSKANHTGS